MKDCIIGQRHFSYHSGLTMKISRTRNHKNTLRRLNTALSNSNSFKTEMTRGAKNLLGIQ